MKVKMLIAALLLSMLIILAFELITPIFLKAEQSGNPCSAIMCATPSGVRVVCVDFYRGAFLCRCTDC
ncbi:hypothetical protein [Candidatus Kryptobacter tengchongensis]|uniref:Uncharacterized protein n=1 Tax=Kryptobacter tengchongensis TaxID=1643429 RepID=A0A916PIK8_KRYT1|nr:hypothetical protein [Candidatus Kryptobacter tengchongensis]CUS90383.1 hypothetical protein JGI20_01336 [Candidatus Kryptobacter tengchongensis]CUT05617.1 hypothetical protein JGI25_01617 [Candidatus Kryptobacter tengchongensis]